MKILFNEELHKYYLEGTDKVFTSVSKVLDLISPKFDVEAQAIKYSEKPREDILKGLAKSNSLTLKEAKDKWGGLELNAEQIKQIWKDKNEKVTARGTAFHYMKEQELLAQGGYVHKTSNGDKVAYDFNEIKNLKAGIYPELIMYHLPTWTIGTADYIKINEDKSFFIRDWKSNEDLQVTAKKYYKKDKGFSDYEYLKTPVSHLHNTKFNKYQLQLSMYSYMLEYLGYRFTGGIIDHVIFDEYDKPIKVDEYPIVYMKKEVEAILKLFKLQSK